MQQGSTAYGSFSGESKTLNCCCVAHGCSHKSQEANYQELSSFCDLTRILSMVSQPVMMLTNDLASLWSLYSPFCSFPEQCSFTALRLSVLTATLQAGALEHSASNEIEANRGVRRRKCEINSPLPETLVLQFCIAFHILQTCVQFLVPTNEFLLARTYIPKVCFKFIVPKNRILPCQKPIFYNSVLHSPTYKTEFSLARNPYSTILYCISRPKKPNSPLPETHILQFCIAFLVTKNHISPAIAILE